MQAPAPGERQWLPLESNPDVVSTFWHRMGASPLWKVDLDSCSRLVRGSDQPGPRHASRQEDANRTSLEQWGRFVCNSHTSQFTRS